MVQSSSEKTTTIEEGKPMVLSINVADVKSAKWLYNGKKVGRGVNIKEDGNTYTLNIDKMKKSDAGSYTFEATSPTGHVIKEHFEVTYRGMLVNSSLHNNPFFHFSNKLFLLIRKGITTHFTHTHTHTHTHTQLTRTFLTITSIKFY